MSQEKEIQVTEQDIQQFQQKLESWAQTLNEKEAYIFASTTGGQVEGGDVSGYVFYDPRTRSIGVRRGGAPAGTVAIKSFNVPFVGRVTSLK